MTGPTPPDRVLSTLNADGTRNWIRPRLAKGRFLTARQIVGYGLIALFVFLPRIRIGGRPAFLIDLISREVSIFGALFRPSDGFLLMFFGLAVVMTVFFVTAMYGRVWCGWGCPQTVYLEHVFRPIERWIEGGPAGSRKLDAAGGLSGRRVLKWVVFVGLSFALSNVFLAYFVGTDRLEQWVFTSPLEHLGGFTVVAGVSGLMFFDFAYFREQACIVACPYGRLQAAMLDKQSLIVGYDSKRGEPRGKPGKKSLPVVADDSGKPKGDCVDCGACVAVCPTGIDIRQGLQMECVGCAQCIDACEPVMAKLGKPAGLIRYTSQDELEGKPRKVLRLRTIVYPVLMALMIGLFMAGFGEHSSTEVWVERNQGANFITMPDGKIASQIILKLENKGDISRTYAVALVDAPDGTLQTPITSWQVGPHKQIVIPLFINVAPETFVHGERKVHLSVKDTVDFTKTVGVTLLGPEGPARGP
jgi:cytochrome c oxidase accessory protein FixG